MIRATATIVRGRKSNRVRRVKRVIDPSPQRALRRYRKDPTATGLPYTVISLCLPVAELAAIDSVCEALGLARSQLLRLAARTAARAAI